MDESVADSFRHIPLDGKFTEPLTITWEQLTRALQDLGLCDRGTTYQGTAGRLLACIAQRPDSLL